MEEIKFVVVNISKNKIEYDYKDVIGFEEYNEIVDAKKFVYEYSSYSGLLSIVNSNFDTLNDYFHNTTKDVVKKSESSHGVTIEYLDEIKLETNRHLLNYLSSIRTLIDHSSAFLTRKFGKNSSQLEKFDRKTNYLFDHSFEYQFAYKLRNYSQHVGLPVTRVNYNASINSDKKVEVFFAISFDTRHLLNSYESWKPQTKEILSKLEYISVRGFIVEIKELIYELYYTFLEQVMPPIHKSAEYLNTYLEKYRCNPEDLHIVKIKTDSNGRARQMMLEPMFGRIIRKILEDN